MTLKVPYNSIIYDSVIPCLTHKFIRSIDMADTSWRQNSIIDCLIQKSSSRDDINMAVCAVLIYLVFRQVFNISFYLTFTIPPL